MASHLRQYHLGITENVSFSLQHALPLPFFLLLAKDIYKHAVLFSNSGKLKKHSFIKTNRSL